MAGFRLVKVNAYSRNSGRVSKHLRGSVSYGNQYGTPARRKRKASAHPANRPSAITKRSIRKHFAESQSSDNHSRGLAGVASASKRNAKDNRLAVRRFQRSQRKLRKKVNR